MQPTVPAWVSWYRRARAREQLRTRESHPRISVYFGDPGSGANVLWLNSAGVVSGPRGLATPPGGSVRDRYPLDDWRMPIPIMPDIKQRLEYDPFPIVLGGSADEPISEVGAGGLGVTVGEGGAARWQWGASARGLAAGAALLAVFALLVRSAEKYLDKKLRRRQAEEWPTPSVLATSSRNQSGTEQSEPPPFPPDVMVDSPPPYSQCAAAEEPPPPYSACYVGFDSLKDEPAVHFYNRPQADAASSSSDINHTGNTQLVFENGRVVERVDKDVTETTNHTEQTAENTTQERVAVA